jgi:catechol 2,3-dioxygenase-like lactoylglutathione lyase family enzyme
MQRWVPHGEVGNETVLAELAAAPEVWARWSLVGQGDTWQVQHGELVAGMAPPTWEPVTWEYPNAVFVADVVPGDVVARWLATGAVEVAGRSSAVGELQQRVRWDRRASHETGGFEPLPWAAAEAQVTMSTTRTSPPTDHLVSERSPAFVTFAAAAAAFFHSPRSPGGTVADGVVLRVQDGRGRLTGVRVVDDEVQVSVDGEDLAAMVVHLGGAAPGQRHPLELTTAQQVAFPVPGGLPAEAWIVLSSGTQWVDRRFLPGLYARGGDHGVEFVVEPRTKLDAYLAQREGDTLEFKVRVPAGSDAKSVRAVMKTVCAFANGDGGSILFGVDDEGDAVGLPEDRVRALIDDVTNLVDSWVSPRPTIDFDVLPVDATGAQVVLELVVTAAGGLCGAGRPSEHQTVYVRHNGRSVPARPSEIEALVRSRLPGPGARPFGSLLL